jgi:hypothetical protein
MLIDSTVEDCSEQLTRISPEAEDVMVVMDSLTANVELVNGLIDGVGGLRSNNISNCFGTSEPFVEFAK